MSLIDALRFRLRVLFNPARHERERELEFRTHLELDAMQQRDAAHPPAIARRRFGNLAGTHEATREASGVAFLDDIVRDIRFAVRTLRRRPTVAAVAILVSAIGIAGATSLYAVVDGVVLRPLPFADPSRLVAVWHTHPEWKRDPNLAHMWDHEALSIPDFRDLQTGDTGLDAIGVWGGWSTVIKDGDVPEEVRYVQASASLLPMLGVRPIIGRTYAENEDVVGGPPVALLTFERWMARYGGDSSAVGRNVMLNGTSYTIIGVLPRGLALRRGERPAAYWIPAGQDTASATQRGYHDFSAVARLKRGDTPERAALAVGRILHASDKTLGDGVFLAGWREDQTRDFRRPLMLLLAGAAMLLVIACVNVATLLTGEAITRDHEMATRIALGAGRARLVRQLTTESVTLALAGGGLGTLLASWATRALVRIAPAAVPGLRGVSIDFRVLTFAITATLVTGVVFGLIPAFGVFRRDPAEALASARGESGRQRAAVQRTLVAIELALSVILLVNAGLLARSFANLTSTDPGFRSERLLVVQSRLPSAQYGTPALAQGLYRDVTARLLSLSDVESATAATAAPFTGSSSSTSITVVGRPDTTAFRGVQRRMTLPSYFATMGIPIVAGRGFSDEDRENSTPVVVISAMLARLEWPGESPIGQQIRLMSKTRTVVGIAGDVKFAQLSSDNQAQVYMPYAQECCRSLDILVRSRGEPADMISAVRAVVHDIAPTVPVTLAVGMSTLISASFADERYRTMLIGVFAIIATILASAGVYGVATRSVQRRTRELAIRTALGASASMVQRLFVRDSLAGAGIGLVAGGIGAVITARFTEPYLFHVGARDGVTYAGTMMLLLTLTIVASWIPARRASRVQPSRLLRVG